MGGQSRIPDVGATLTFRQFFLQVLPSAFHSFNLGKMIGHGSLVNHESAMPHRHEAYHAVFQFSSSNPSTHHPGIMSSATWCGLHGPRPSPRLLGAPLVTFFCKKRERIHLREIVVARRIQPCVVVEIEWHMVMVARAVACFS